MWIILKGWSVLMIEGAVKKVTPADHEDSSIYGKNLSVFDLIMRACLQEKEAGAGAEPL